MVCEQEYMKLPPPPQINDIGYVTEKLAFIHST